MAAENPERPMLARLLPASLRSRLTLTVLLANVALMLVGGLVFLAFISLDRPNQLQREASSALQAAAQGLESRLELVDAIASTAAVAPSMTGLDAEQPEALERMRSRLAGIAENSGLDAAVLVSPEGAVTTAVGDEALIAGLESLLKTAGVSAVRGLIDMGETGIGVVAVRPLSIVDSGFIAVIQQVDPASLAPPHAVRFENTGGASPGDTVLSGFGSPLYSTTLLTSYSRSGFVRAELLGIDGRPAGWLALTIEPDPGASDIFGLSFLVAAGLAVIVSLLVGVGLTVLIRRPLETLVTHVHRHGHAALEGHAVTHLAADPMLPDELKNLAEVYDRLLDHLARRQAEAADATRALQFAVNDSFEAKLLLRDDKVALANTAAAKLLGIPADHPLEEWDALLDSLELETEDGTPVTPDDVLQTMVGEPTVLKVGGPGIPTRWIELRVIEHTDPQRTTLITGRDVTEQRRVEAVREEIISLVSHDLRAPLTVIGGYLDLLERPLPDESRAKAVTAAKRSAERMAVLLEDLLTATRAEELFSPVSLDPVSLAELAEETASSFEHTSAHTLVASASDRGLVLGEERRLRQVLVNLVSNAIKHAPEAGTIEITVESRAGRVVVSVQDDGPGIPAGEREVVFERFARLTASGENRPGIGLGLYIVRAIVESHGGTVQVEDRPDGNPGACFVIELPGHHIEAAEDATAPEA